jgi:hypothetical protein
MLRATVCAAVAAACLAFAVPAPAQARMANPVLNEIAPANVLVQDVQYRRDRRRYNRNRYRHCWNQRIRVRVGSYRYVWRVVRRCDWRYRYR